MKKSKKPQTGVREQRIFNFGKLSVEERGDGLGPKIVGHAAVFNTLSEDLGGFKEKIAPEAFKKAIPKSDVRGLFNHDSNYVLGRQSNGTLSLKEDKEGLWMEIDPPDTQIIRDLVIEPIRRGDITQQSFAFIVAKDQWEGLEEKDNQPVVRTILEVNELFDVSPVTFPAYPDTSVALRRLDKVKEERQAFVPVSDEEITRNHLDIFLGDASSEEDRQASAKFLVELLLPEMLEEDREKLIPTPEVEGITPTNGDGIVEPVNGETKSHDTEDRWNKLDERFKGMGIF